MILVTATPPSRNPGASPTEVLGRRLARRLVAAEHRVRVLTEQAHGWPSGADIVTGSIRRPADSPDVMKGVTSVFLAGAEAATIDEVTQQAARHGVKRIVVLSSHGCEFEAHYPPETWFWLAIERAVERYGGEWTHIRPSAVMASMLEGTYPATGAGWQTSIMEEGVVREPLLARGRYPFIHEDDLAAVAAATLREDGYVGTVVEAVNLPISTLDRVRAISQAIGRPIGVEELSVESGRDWWRREGWPDETIDVTLFALEEYDRDIEALTRWTLDQRPSVRDIIGRPPRTFAEWAVEHAAAFRTA